MSQASPVAAQTQAAFVIHKEEKATATAKRNAGALGKCWRTLARSPGWGICCVAMISLAVSITLALVVWPQPAVHDEFAYLLAGDTFAHGRLTNPTHPAWRFLESFHILQQPSYQAKYPPGQGLMLALGQVLCGEPLAGVWITMALAAGAFTWMLAGWLPWRWALFGGALFALHPTIQLGWGHSYWGGELAFAGGALVFGGLPRLQQKVALQPALLMGLGAVLLMVTRPYEGAIACVCTGLALLWSRMQLAAPHWSRFVTRVILPASSVIGLGLVGWGVYNQEVTGSPLRLPYSVHEQHYGISPLFVWQSPKPTPDYNHQVLRDFHTGWEMNSYRQHQTWSGVAQEKLDGTVQQWAFFYGALLTLPLVVAVPQLLRDPQLRFAKGTLGVMFGASLLVYWMLPHYFSPAAPLLLLIVVQAVRHITASARRGWPVARNLPAVILVAELIVLLASVATFAADPVFGWAEDRAKIQTELSQLPGQQLVVVEYGPEHNVHQEWVYNGAEIDTQPVVWVRSLGLAANAELQTLFPTRTIWRLQADTSPPQLQRYAPEQKAENPFGDEGE